MDFIEKIYQEMKDKRITGVEIEENTGVKRQTLSSWKNGTTPTIDKAIKVIKYLGLSADEIFEIENKKSSITINQNLDWKLEATMKKTSEWLQYIIESNDIQEMHELARGLQIIIDKEINSINKD